MCMICMMRQVIETEMAIMVGLRDPCTRILHSCIQNTPAVTPVLDDARSTNYIALARATLQGSVTRRRRHGLDEGSFALLDTQDYVHH